MEFTISNLIRNASLNFNIGSDEECANLVESLFQTLGANNISTQREVKLEPVMMLRKVVRNIMKHNAKYKNKTLQRILPTVNSLLSLRLLVVKYWRISTATATATAKATATATAATAATAATTATAAATTTATSSISPMVSPSSSPSQSRSSSVISKSPTVLDELVTHYNKITILTNLTQEILSNITRAWSQAHLLEEQSIAETKKNNSKTKTDSLELFIVTNIRKELKVIQEELEQIISLLAAQLEILLSSCIEATDVERLHKALIHARKLSNELTFIRCQNWQQVLDLGSQRKFQAETFIDTRLRLQVGDLNAIGGVIDIATLQNALHLAKEHYVGGMFVNKMKRVLNELELAKNAIGEINQNWNRRRNIGVGREMVSKKSPGSSCNRSARRPVDDLTDRLSSGARLRDFVGLSTNTNTLYVCNSMLMSPGLKVERNGLEGCKELITPEKR